MKNNCKICGSETREFYDKNFDVHYYQCCRCEFIFRDESALISVDEEKEDYDRHNNTYEDQYYTDMFRNLLDTCVVPFRTEGRKALDFGSGPEPVLAKVLTDEYGYDTDIYDLFYAPDKVYENKKYDLITCTEVVEHLMDPMYYFRLFKSLIKDDGIIAIMTLFHPNDDAKFLNWHYHREPTHISYFTPKTMTTIADTLGLVIHFNDNKRCCSFSLKK